MERKNIRIRRDETLRIKFLKNELKLVILKSITRTSELPELVRFYAFTKIQKKYAFVSRWKNFCLLTGRARGNTKMFNVSRHMLNKISQQGYTSGFTRNNFR
jgi:ribosomal protein S14